MTAERLMLLVKALFWVWALVSVLWIVTGHPGQFQRAGVLGLAVALGYFGVQSLALRDLAEAMARAAGRPAELAGAAGAVRRLHARTVTTEFVVIVLATLQTGYGDYFLDIALRTLRGT